MKIDKCDITPVPPPPEFRFNLSELTQEEVNYIAWMCAIVLSQCMVGNNYPAERLADKLSSIVTHVGSWDESTTFNRLD